MSLNTEALFYSRYLIDLQYISHPSSGALKWKNNETLVETLVVNSKTLSFLFIFTFDVEVVCSFLI